MLHLSDYRLLVSTLVLGQDHGLIQNNVVLGSRLNVSLFTLLLANMRRDTVRFTSISPLPAKLANGSFKLRDAP